jgi:hypothetical protein
MEFHVCPWPALGAFCWLLLSNWCGGAAQLGQGLLFRPGVETLSRVYGVL